MRIAMKLRRFLKGYVEMLNTGARPAGVPKQAPQAISPSRERPIVNILLFLATLCTTTLAGASQEGGFWASIAGGLPYSLTLMSILLCHEFGHYFAARRFGVRVTLPYFIPIPPIAGWGSIVGTMGAVIKTKSPIPDRRALLYVGVMGPIPGFLISLAAVTVGIALSEVKQLPAPGGDYLVPVFGDSLLFGLIARLIHGPMPPGHDLFLSPYAWAGWIGFLITGLNLMPIGQLDGGHVLYALMGRRQRYVGWVALAGLVGLSFIWIGWVIWIILTLTLLMVAHPEVPEGDPLSVGERVMGWIGMLILVLTFIPKPVEFL